VVKRRVDLIEAGLYRENNLLRLALVGVEIKAEVNSIRWLSRSRDQPLDAVRITASRSHFI
jgi:hypothetical protein